MRSRTLREGSVGLLILLGIGLLGAIILWLQGLQPGKRSYKVFIEFNDALGLQTGNPVRFRGIDVGRVTDVAPGSNGVVVTTEINPATLLIPRNVIAETSQSGFIGEVYVNLIPRQSLPPAALERDLGPFAECDRQLIICDGDTLRGQIGVSYDELIRATVQLAEVLGDPKLIANVNRAASNTAIAAASVDRLSRQTQRELAGFSTALNSVSRAANQVDRLANRSGGSITRLEGRLGQAANRVGGAADQVSSLVQTNRGTLVTTLNDLSQTSRELRTTTRSLSPALNRISQGQLIQSLEVLTANAVQASANLRDLTAAVNSPANLLVLQQTLDSARVTFQNTQKITTDLNELTGDPTLRIKLRNLINGLSNLVSSTQELEQQVQTAETLPTTVPPVQVDLKRLAEFQSSSAPK